MQRIVIITLTLSGSYDHYYWPEYFLVQLHSPLLFLSWTLFCLLLVAACTGAFLQMYTFIPALLLSLHLFSSPGGEGESWGWIHTFAFLPKPHPTQGSNCCSPSYIWNPVHSLLIYLVLLSKSGVVEKKKFPPVSFHFQGRLSIWFCFVWFKTDWCNSLLLWQIRTLSKEGNRAKERRERVSHFLEIYEAPIRAQAAGHCSPRFRPRVSKKQKDSKTHLHLSHLGGVGVFIFVIFLFPSPLSWVLPSAFGV